MTRIQEDSEAFTDLLEVLLRIAKGVEAIAEARVGENPGTWRDEPASEKQKAFLKKYDIYFETSITKGEASDIIDRFLKAKKSDENMRRGY